MDITAEFESIIDALIRDRVEYAICGGFAVNLHGHVRATRDINLLVQSTALPELLTAIRPLGFVIESGPIPFGAGTSRERVLHRVTKARGPAFLTLDLLLVTPIFEDVWRTRVAFEWRGRQVSVVSLTGLEFMKRLSDRTQDRADLEALGLAGESPHEPAR